MAEPFKNLLNKNVVKEMAKHFKRHWPPFNDLGFITDTLKELDSLELKARSNHIMNSLRSHFPADFEKAAEILLTCLGSSLEEDLSSGKIDANGIAGWAIMPLADYVGLHGQDHFDISMTLFKEMTKRASSEFGIRYFLLKFPDKTLSTMKSWVNDPSHHVRRLASEGCRPRLPWSMQLPMFIKDPLPVIDLLEELKDDDKEYVRRSVANSLNDIAKDHPDLVATIAKKWSKNASKTRKKLIKHACRTLIKNGHQKTLKTLGFQTPRIQKTLLKLLSPEVKFGNALEFSLSISSDSDNEQPLLIDYIIHHQKANGKTSPKVFKWKSINLAANKTLNFNKNHIIKKITTRLYYPGLHGVEIVINGNSIGKVDFQLIM